MTRSKQGGNPLPAPGDPLRETGETVAAPAPRDIDLIRVPDLPSWPANLPLVLMTAPPLQIEPRITFGPHSCPGRPLLPPPRALLAQPVFRPVTVAKVIDEMLQEAMDLAGGRPGAQHAGGTRDGAG